MKIKKISNSLFPIPFILFLLYIYNSFFFDPGWDHTKEFTFLPLAIKECSYAGCAILYTSIIKNILLWIVTYSLYLIFISKTKFKYKFAVVGTILMFIFACILTYILT